MQNLEFWLGYPNPLIPVLVDQPDNWQALESELSFENDSPEAVLNATKLIWKGKTAASMNQWVANGFTGSFGIMEGIPLTIKACDSSDIIFDGIVDLTDSETTFACDTVQCKIRDKKMDMVAQLMGSVSFAYLATPIANNGGGVINPKPQYLGGDYAVIPYQRNELPDYNQVMILALSMFTILDKINDIVDKFTVGELGGETVAVADTSAKVGADADGSILGLFEVIGYIIYLVLLIVLLFELIKNCFNYLVSPVFTKFGMYAKDLLQKACDYFKIGFSSTILIGDPVYSRAIIMPAKSAWSNNKSLPVTILNSFVSSQKRVEYDDLYNYLHNGGANDIGAYGYYDGTPADLIRALSEVFNAKAKIILDNSGKPVLHFERWDFQYNLSTYKLPNISDQTPFNSQGLFNTTGFSQSAFATNASELAGNYMVRYQMDESDENTYEAYEGTSCYCTTRPIVISNVRNVLLQNLTERNMPFSQAKRKEHDTMIEEILGNIYSAFASIYNTIVDAVNAVTGAFNTIIDIINNVLGSSMPTIPAVPSLPSSPGFAMTGHMLLSGHSTSVPKLFIAGPAQHYPSQLFDFRNLGGYSGITIDPNNRGELNMSLQNISARAVMRDFHFSSLPLTKTPAIASLALPYSPSAEYFNQWLIFRKQQVPLCCADYELIKNNNFITSFDDKKAKTLSIKQNWFKGMANIDYRINQQFTKNIQTSFVIDGKEVESEL